jgi:hypothetical protein
MKSQIPITNEERPRVSDSELIPVIAPALGIGIWDFIGIWDLVIGIFLKWLAVTPTNADNLLMHHRHVQRMQMR